MEIPFAFNNTALQAGMTGNGPEARALARKMSKAWINFAKTGKPEADGLPAWEAYSEGTGATMIFDNKCEIRHQDRKSTRLNSSHANISYAVFCLKKKKDTQINTNI